jgi:uncharacterized membrane protein YfcA
MYSVAATLVIITVVSMLSAPSGVGGGLLITPLAQVTIDFTSKQAAALSQWLIFGSSLASVLFLLYQQHKTKSESKIQAKYIYFMLPAVISGSTIGVLIAKVIPTIFQTAVLAGMCFFATTSIFKKAQALYKAESQPSPSGEGNMKPEESAPKPPVDPVTLGNKSMEEGTPTVSHIPSTAHSLLFTSPERRLFLYIVLIFLLNVFFLFLRGSSRTTSIAKIEYCGTGYWGLYALQIFLFALIALIIAPKQIRMSSIVILTGAIGAMSGIGGGLILNPLLLRESLTPQRTTATVIVVVTVTSLTSSIDFFLNSDLIRIKHLYFICFSFIGSVIGMTLVTEMVRRTGRQSYIVFILGSLVACGGTLTACLGLIGIIEDISNHENPFTRFKSPCL